MEEVMEKMCAFCGRDFLTSESGIDLCNSCYYETQEGPFDLEDLQTEHSKTGVCKTCLRVGEKDVERCSKCERCMGNARTDPTSLFKAIEAEAVICQRTTDWDQRLEKMEHVIYVLRNRMEKQRDSQLDEKLKKEVSKCS